MLSYSGDFSCLPEVKRYLGYLFVHGDNYDTKSMKILFKENDFIGLMFGDIDLIILSEKDLNLNRFKKLSVKSPN